MKILFVVSEVFYSEPLGVMQLSAILKNKGHQTKMIVLKRHSLIEHMKQFEPNVIAYSTMSPDIDIFKNNDNQIKKYLIANNLSTKRIMGGPHPTYNQKVLNDLDLDAICIGEGDYAIATIVERIDKNSDLNKIPNVLSKNSLEFEKEIIHDLDSLPFVDRDIFYEAAPEYRDSGIRSILTSRGCPYKCTYCFNHAYNKMFRGVGTILRRRSVDSVIKELKYIVKEYQPVKMIRFADDTFAFRADEWLKEFTERYRNEIGIPFYCLMRSNTLTDGVAQLLAHAGCKSISMSLETGNENIRNNLLKRDLSDTIVKKSFRIARKYNLKTQGNSMLGIPGTKLNDDFYTIEFSRQLMMALPTFGIFSPYPGTDLTDYAIQKGLLDPRNINFNTFQQKSVLNCYSEREKEIMLRLSLLGTFFCILPACFQPLLKVFVKLSLNNFFSVINSILLSYLFSKRMFPAAIPRNPRSIVIHACKSMKYWMELKKTK
jgi:radical SAM superfamily enzyme YgiQ (UPF0313 family)